MRLMLGPEEIGKKLNLFAFQNLLVGELQEQKGLI